MLQGDGQTLAYGMLGSLSQSGVVLAASPYFSSVYVENVQKDNFPNLREVTYRGLFCFRRFGDISVSRFSGLSQGGFACCSVGSGKEIGEARGAGSRILTS